MNATEEPRRKKVLMVVANPATSPVTEWPVGFWWSELTHPYFVFEEAGCHIDIRSPSGGQVEADGFSDPEHESGYSASDFVSLGFKRSPAHAKLLEQTRSIEGLSPADYDAIFVVGGQAPMVNYVGNAGMQKLVAGFFEAGKATALVCHGTCLLLETRLSDGTVLSDGRLWTGFADSEERAVEAAVGRKIQPFWIESEARRLGNSLFAVAPAFRPFAVRDGHLITGQQQFSGTEAARKVLEVIGR